MPTDTPSAMLVWEDAPKCYGALRRIAKTPLDAFYSVSEHVDGWRAGFWAGHTCARIGGPAALHLDEASARAACEADYIRRWREAGLVAAGEVRALCSDCPPNGYPTDTTRCRDCPRRTAEAAPTATPPAPTPAAPAGCACGRPWEHNPGEPCRPGTTVSADAIRAEIAWCEAEVRRLWGGGRDNEEIAWLEGWVAAYTIAASRLSALLPKPAQEEQS